MLLALNKTARVGFVPELSWLSGILDIQIFYYRFVTSKTAHSLWKDNIYSYFHSTIMKLLNCYIKIWKRKQSKHIFNNTTWQGSLFGRLQCVTLIPWFCIFSLTFKVPLNCLPEAKDRWLPWKSFSWLENCQVLLPRLILKRLGLKTEFLWKN